MTTHKRTMRPSLAARPRSNQKDREAAILLVAYPDRMRRPEPEDLWALMDFVFDGNTGRPAISDGREPGDGRRD